MAIPDGTKHNFATLKRAMAEGRVCVVEAKDTKTGEVGDVICMVNVLQDEYQLLPLAFMPRENPFERYAPPDPGNPEAFVSYPDRKEN